MRAVLHLLLMIAVFCCGMHIAEPVQAHAEAAHHQLKPPVDRDDDGPGKSAVEAAHAAHHHCPVAPDQSSPPAARAMMAPAPLLFTAPPVQLASLSQAPPLEPPSA